MRVAISINNIININMFILSIIRFLFDSAVGTGCDGSMLRELFAGAFAMGLSRPFFGGILVGLAFGVLLGAGLSAGKKDVNYTPMAGVGVLLAIVGVSMARAGSRSPAPPSP